MICHNSTVSMPRKKTVSTHQKKRNDHHDKDTLSPSSFAWSCWSFAGSVQQISVLFSFLAAHVSKLRNPLKQLPSPCQSLHSYSHHSLSSCCNFGASLSISLGSLFDAYVKLKEEKVKFCFCSLRCEYWNRERKLI